jgi:hypothetical protein
MGKNILQFICFILVAFLSTSGYAQEKGIQIVEKGDGFVLMIDCV